jgi:hypothetical protein
VGCRELARIFPWKISSKTSLLLTIEIMDRHAGTNSRIGGIHR